MLQEGGYSTGRRLFYRKEVILQEGGYSTGGRWFVSKESPHTYKRCHAM